MSLAGFQRRRRILAAKAAAEAKASVTPENAAAGQNEPDNDELVDDQLGKPISPDDVDKMDLADVKAALDQLEVKFAHNTGEQKLREKLKDAIG